MPPTAQAGVSGNTGGGRLISKLIKQTILPKCVQVLKRRRSRSTQTRQHGPCVAGRRPTDDVSAGPAETLQGDGAPLKAEGQRREPWPPRGRVETRG